MTYKDGDTLISSAVAVNPDDVKALLELQEMGIEVEIRKLASEPKGDLMSALKAKGLA
jgi:PTS system mannose-specific IIB component